MFILDSLVAAPFKGLAWIFEKVAEAADESQAAELETIKMALAELYTQLAEGSIDEATFDERERALLDRLDVLEAQS